MKKWGIIYTGINSFFFVFLQVYAPSALSQIAIGEPAIIRIQHDRATIEWTTSLKTTGAINFGTTPKLGQSATAKDYAIGHTLTIRHLRPKTRYFFQIVSTNQQGKKSTSKIYSFTTDSFQEPDKTILKIISPPQVTHLSATKVIVSWETNQPATSIVTYGYKNQKRPTVYMSEIETTTHIITLDGLTPNSRYYYQVKSGEKKGKTVESTYASFKTHKSGRAQALPSIYHGPSVAIRKADEIKIEWSSDRPCKSHVMWGNMTSASSQQRKGVSRTFASFHRLHLPKLEKGKTYTYVINLEDMEGRKSTSEVFTIQTEMFD